MTTEIDFKSCCPVAGCINSNSIYYWVHTGCGGHEKLNIYGDLRCLKCGRSGPMVDWKFNCGSHDFEKGSYQGYLHLVKIMCDFASEDLLDFVDELSSVIRKWKREGRFNS